MTTSARSWPALGRGLRAFHEAVGEEWCPFRFDIERALDHVRRRVATDDIDPAGFHEEHRHLSPAAALAELEATAPADEDLVVCHGDYCPPNVLLRDGAVTGYVDLGELGAADRWWDVAAGGWSTCWNFGERVRAALLRELRHHARPGAHPLLPAALRPGVLTGAAARLPAAAISRRARRNTASNIGTVSFPVNVFCWLGWYEPSSATPSGSGALGQVAERRARPQAVAAPPPPARRAAPARPRPRRRVSSDSSRARYGRAGLPARTGSGLLAGGAQWTAAVM